MHWPVIPGGIGKCALPGKEILRPVLPEIFSENVLFGENFLKFHGILIFIAFLLLNILTSTYLKSTLCTSSGKPGHSCEICCQSKFCIDFSLNIFVS